MHTVEKQAAMDGTTPLLRCIAKITVKGGSANYRFSVLFHPVPIEDELGETKKSQRSDWLDWLIEAPLCRVPQVLNLLDGGGRLPQRFDRAGKPCLIISLPRLAS